MGVHIRVTGLLGGRFIERERESSALKIRWTRNLERIGTLFIALPRIVTQCASIRQWKSPVDTRTFCGRGCIMWLRLLELY